MSAASATEAAEAEEAEAEGVVLSRRALGKKIVFVDVGDGESASVQALLKPAGSGRIANEGLDAPLEKHTIALGARVVLRGTVRPSQSGTPLLVARTARLVAAAPSKHGVRTVVDAVRERRLSAAAAAEALGASVDEVDVLQAGGEAAEAPIVRRLRERAPEWHREAADGVRPVLSAAGREPALVRIDVAAKAAAADVEAAGGARAAAAALDAGEVLSVAEARGGGGAAAGGRLVVVRGEVAARRRLDDDVIVVDITDGAAADGTPRLTCVLMHPALDDEDGNGWRPTYAQLAAAGAELEVAGRWVDGGDDGAPPSLLVFAARLRRCSAAQKVVRLALESVASGALPADEGAEALRWSGESGGDGEEGRGSRLRALLASESVKEREWRVVETAAALHSARAAAAGGRDDDSTLRALLDRLARCARAIRCGSFRSPTTETARRSSTNQCSLRAAARRRRVRRARLRGGGSGSSTAAAARALRGRRRSARSCSS